MIINIIIMIMIMITIIIQCNNNNNNSNPRVVSIILYGGGSINWTIDGKIKKDGQED